MNECVAKCHGMEHEKVRIKKECKSVKMGWKDKRKCDKIQRDKWSVSEGEKWKEMKLSEIWRLWGEQLTFEIQKMPNE